MPQAVGAAILGEVGLVTGATVLGLGAAEIVGFAVLTAATGGLTFTLTTAEEPARDSAERDPET